MITWGPCDHPLRPDGCRVCALLGSPRPECDRMGRPYRRRTIVEDAWLGREAEANTWAGDVGNTIIGSHLTIEQMRAIELGWRRGCNRGTRFETEEGLQHVLEWAEPRRRGIAGEPEDVIARICPPQSRRPAWLINWMLAQRQKHLVEQGASDGL